MNQSKLGRREFVYSLLSHIESMTEGSQSKNSRKEPGSQNWSPSHGGELPKALLPEASSDCFLIYSVPSVDWWRNLQWAGFSLINHLLRKCPRGFLTDKSTWIIFSTEVDSSSIILACVELSKELPRKVTYEWFWNIFDRNVNDNFCKTTFCEGKMQQWKLN